MEVYVRVLWHLLSLCKQMNLIYKSDRTCISSKGIADFDKNIYSRRLEGPCQRKTAQSRATWIYLSPQKILLSGKSAWYSRNGFFFFLRPAMGKGRVVQVGQTEYKIGMKSVTSHDNLSAPWKTYVCTSQLKLETQKLKGFSFKKLHNGFGVLEFRK